jgi:hypothetical protein
MNNLRYDLMQVMSLRLLSAPLAAAHSASSGKIARLLPETITSDGA